MTATEILLGNLFPGHDPALWRANASGAVELAAGDDVIVNIREDETASVVHFYSAPGYFPAGSPPDDPMPEEAQGTLAGAVSHGYRHVDTGLFMLLRTVPRERLDDVSFRDELDRHVARCRAWAAVLAPTPPLEEPIHQPPRPAMASHMSA
jgi:hypothetical protein